MHDSVFAWLECKEEGELYPVMVSEYIATLEQFVSEYTGRADSEIRREILKICIEKKAGAPAPQLPTKIEEGKGQRKTQPPGGEAGFLWTRFTRDRI